MRPVISKRHDNSRRSENLRPTWRCNWTTNIRIIEAAGSPFRSFHFGLSPLRFSGTTSTPICQAIAGPRFHRNRLRIFRIMDWDEVASIFATVRRAVPATSLAIRRTTEPTSNRCRAAAVASRFLREPRTHFKRVTHTTSIVGLSKRILVSHSDEPTRAIGRAPSQPPIG